MSGETLITTPCAFGENGNFLLERELGRGGMGGVYMGRDKMLDRPVAVKVMLKEYGSDQEFVEKFKKEAQAAARLIHPNIAQIYSYGIADGMPYIAMELVAGGSLDILMRNQGADIEVPRVMKICEQVAQALRCAADQGLVHGDVKPENVLLDANGNAKLVDFGLAAMQKDTSEIWGTPYYIAPEKVRKQPVDYRADMYSLGGTIYHALCATAPFEGEDATEVVRKRFAGPPKKPSEVRPGLSPQIDALVMRMLAVDPKDRFPSFEALLDEFKRVMTTGLSSTQPVSDAAHSGDGGVVASSSKTASGGKKKIVLGRKKLKFGANKSLHRADAGDDAAGGAEQDGAAMPEPVPATPAEEEEEGGGNLGLKVALVVGGVVLAIAAVVGLLWYVTSSNASGNEKAAQAKIEKTIRDASGSLDNTARVVESYMGQMDSIAEESMKLCREYDKKLAREIATFYKGDVNALMSVPVPQEVIDAENALKAPLPEPVPAAEEPKSEEKAAEGEAKSSEAEAKQAGGEVKAAEPSAPAPSAEPAPEAAPAADEPAVPEVPPVVDAAVQSMKDVWGKMYAAQAAELRIRKQLKDILADVDKSKAVKENSEEEMRRIAADTTRLQGRFDSVKASKDAELVSKIRGRVETSCEKLLRTTKTKINTARNEAERAAEKARRETEDKEREEARKNERARRVEEELGLISEKFQSIAAAGNFRQLDWNGARRQMNALKDGLETGEGAVQLKKEIQKIDMMESVQKTFVANLEGYVFVRNQKDRSTLKGMKVVKVDSRNIELERGAPRAASKKLSWQRFYSDYHANVDELYQKFIRKNEGRPRLSPIKRADAMIGFALTLQTVWADDETSAPAAVKIATEAVKSLPSYLEKAKEAFPEIDFSKVAEEVAAEQL